MMSHDIATTSLITTCEVDEDQILRLMVPRDIKQACKVADWILTCLKRLNLGLARITPVPVYRGQREREGERDLEVAFFRASSEAIKTF